MNSQNLHFEAHCQYPGDYYVGVTVKSKHENQLVLHVYLLSHFLREVPRSHMFGLVTILNAPNTPEDLLGSIHPDFTDLVIKKNNILLSSQLIESIEVTNFSELAYKAHLWEAKRHYDFDENSKLSEYKELIQADVTITVKEEKLIAHIAVGAQWKSVSAEASPFWYLENTAVQPALYKALYVSLGGKWMCHEGEIGAKGTRKPMKGMTGYYMNIPKLGEDWVSKQIDEGYQLVYKNYNTTHYLEEDLREQLKNQQAAENKSDDSEEAFEAFENKDVAALQNILEKGVHPDSLKNDSGDHLLYEIADAYETLENEHFEMFTLLLEHGATPNLDDFRPLIHQVCYRRKESFADEMIQQLLAHNVAIDSVRSHDKESLLQSAAINGKLALVMHLVEKGHDINYKTKTGHSALILAVQNNRSTVETIQYLLDNGADKNELFQFYDRKSILNRVVKDDRIDILRYLVSLGVDVNAKEEDGYPCIFDCAEYGPSMMFEALVHLGADVKSHLHNILFRLDLRLRDKGFPKNVKDTAFQKLQFLHAEGYDITNYEMLDSFIDGLKDRKKIKKFEEKMVISLLEMGYKPERETKFLEYVHKVNSTAILNAYEKVK